MANEFVEATFYAQVEPDWQRYSGGYDPDLKGVKVSRITQQRPTAGGWPEPRGGTVVVKLTLRLPRSAFEPLKPEAVITVPADMVDVHPLQVEATAGEPT